MNEEDEKTKIYVGELPQGVTSQDLHAYFITFGEIKGIEIPRDHLTNKFRGFAFVEFDEREDASAAIDNYDKSEFMGKTIKVRRARPINSKPNYHEAVWANDEWMQNMELRKMEKERLTREQEEANRKLGLPIFKQVEVKEVEKPIIYIEND